MSLKKTIALSLAASFLLTCFSACEQKEVGPAEQAGKKLDETMQQAGKKIDDTMQQAGKQLEAGAKDPQQQ